VLLRAVEVSRRFRGLQALTGYNLDLQAGEILGVIGPNGAGKTTLFNVMTGFVRPTTGSIELRGEEITQLRPDQVARRGIARTFQTIRLFGKLSVLDNVKIGQQLHGKVGFWETLVSAPSFIRKERELEKQAMQRLDDLGLADLHAYPAMALSYGDQRKVEIARALALEPQVVLLDEPAAGMNPFETTELLSFIRGIHERYTKFLSKYFIARYTEQGGKMLLEDTYKSGDKDFSAQLTKIKNLDPQPDFVFVSAIPDDIGTIVKQARDQGVMLPIVGGDGYDTPLLTDVPGPEKSANVFFSTHLGIYGDDPTAGKFRAAFVKEFGAEPQSVFAALAYDGVYLMADAITRAGSVDHKAIRDALAATKGWKGASGEITYPPGERIPSKSVALIEVKNGKFNLLEIVVPNKIPAP
jgi:ABC-type branched-subunit amino acid transport system ATPase component